MSAAHQPMFVLTGSYAEEADKGIRIFRFNEENGQLTEIGSYSGLKNPTFLNVDTKRRILYAIAEGVNGEGKKIGEAVSFRIDEKAGELVLLNRTATVQSTTCHIQRDRNSRFLSVTSYHGGMIGLLQINEDGSIGELADVHQHTGGSVDPERQDRPHPHSSFYSPDGRYMLVQDLGLDEIIVYELDADAGKLIRSGATKLHGGAGPRHLTFHPNGKFVYVINELDSTVTGFAYDPEGGSLRQLQTISTLPAEYGGENGCAEIAISADGRYLYGSNRGHDSIVVYAVDPESGQLKLVQHHPAGGGHPRHFALTPSGEYLLVANRDANNIVTLRVNQDNGTLNATGQEVEVSKPVCVIPVYFD